MRYEGVVSLQGPTFPRPSEMDRVVRATPLPPAPPGLGPAQPWTLSGPFPRLLGTVEPLVADATRPLTDELVRASGGSARHTEGARCVARELARFLIARGHLPPEATAFVIGARCGAPIERFESVLTSLPLDDGTDDALVRAAQAAPEFPRLAPRNETREVGAAIVREAGRAALVRVSLQSSALLSAAPRSPDAQNRIVIRGTLPRPFINPDARITSGAWAVARCESPRTTEPFAFVLVCPMAASDSEADVEVWAQTRESPQRRPLVALTVSRQEQLSLVSSGFPSANAPDNAQSADDDLIARLNRARIAAGVAGLRPATRQAQAICPLAPWYLAATRGALPPNTRPLLERGFMAGWSVDELVADAAVLAIDESFPDARTAFETSMLRPTRREVLLSPQWDRVVACSRRGDHGAIEGVAWALYDTLHSEESESESAQVLARINARRAESGWAPLPTDALLTTAATRAAQHFLDGSRDQRGALAEAWVTASTGDSQAGFSVGHGGDGTITVRWLASQTVDDLVVPEDLIALGGSLGVAVVHLRMTDSAWARRLTLIVSLDTHRPPP